MTVPMTLALLVWRGDPELVESKQGLRVLGVSAGRPSLSWS